MLKDEIYPALVRFVQFWRHNFPTLRTLFEIVFGGQEIEAELDERKDAIQESRGIYAATIMLVVGRALGTLRADLGASMNDWRPARIFTVEAWVK